MNALQRLAQSAGLETAYYDIFGNYHEVSTSVQTRVLSRMGFAVGNEEELEHSAFKQENHAWLSLLEPVTVLSEEQALCIEVNAVDDGESLLGWRLEEETGLQHSGELPLARLECVAEREIDGQRVQRFQLPLPKYLPLGYHQLQVALSGDCSQRASSTIILTPARCYSVENACQNRRPWGVAAQLYSLRDAHNWGMGDYSDIPHLARAAAQHGASLLGLNPLHAAFTGHGHHISPYSPTSRSFLHVGYVDVAAIPELSECDEARQLLNSEQFQVQLAQQREMETVDYAGVWACKLPILQLLHKHFAKHHRDADTERGADYRQFCARGGEALRRQAVFDALFTHFLQRDSNCFGWTSWPLEYQRADSDAVARFAESHYEQLDFWRYLQWQAHLQLKSAAEQSRAAGMDIGLYLDLAVGSDGSGADVWADNDCFVPGVSVGAPPDKLSPAGQVWGLSPYNPVALRQNAYKPFIQALRASTQYAGALRIDHVLGLMRQFWVLEGEHADQGVYVHQPMDELLKIIALESHRAQCIIIGEALGTVPEGMVDKLAAVGMLSYKVLYFERWPDGLFKRSDTYPTDALVTVSTHDLPPLAGWWQGSELREMSRLGHFKDSAAEQHEWDQRAFDRQRLLDALEDAGALPAMHGIDPNSGELDQRIIVAVQQFLASTPCSLLAVPVEDLLGLDKQVNLPGTVHEHPNWQQRLPCASAELLDGALSQRLLQTIRRCR
ncbi:MAG: 4-alpha-glucanotransferase [Granulosicoccaceae bacterium]